MKFLYIVTFTALFITLTSAQDVSDSVDVENIPVVDEVEQSVSGEAPEDFKSISNIDISAGKHDDRDVDVIEHEGEDLVRVVKSKSGGPVTEYYTIINIDVKSDAGDQQGDEDQQKDENQGDNKDDEGQGDDGDLEDGDEDEQDGVSAYNEDMFENYFASNLNDLD